MQQEIWFQKYQILHLLGSGGTARVYLAKHIKLNSYRAIKCISKTHPLYDLQRKEALILKNLKHSCIPIIYDIEEDEEGSYIVEQYLEGDTLKDYIMSKGPIREKNTLLYAIWLCDLLHYLHTANRPILYVDLKPENILVTEKHLKLIDFGSAIFRDEYTKEQKLTATRGYAAPELYLAGIPDERCDIYGIGMLLYYMLTGTMISQNTRRIANIDQTGSCSKELRHIINRCLRFNPALRYKSVEELKKQLSVLMQSRTARQESGHRQIIAVAGTQARIGVTHMSLRLCNFIMGQGKSCIYVEENQNGTVRRLKYHRDTTAKENGVLTVRGIPVAYPDCGYYSELSSYPVKVIDYGILSEDKLEPFLEADIRLLILGAKEWELSYSEEVLERIAEYKDIIYLFNFLDSRQFREVVRNMENRSCYRIPYEPNLFGKITEDNGYHFFEEITGYPWKRIRKTTKRRRSGRKGAISYEA